MVISRRRSASARPPVRARRNVKRDHRVPDHGDAAVAMTLTTYHQEALHEYSSSMSVANTSVRLVIGLPPGSREDTPAGPRGPLPCRTIRCRRRTRASGRGHSIAAWGLRDRTGTRSSYRSRRRRSVRTSRLGFLSSGDHAPEHDDLAAPFASFRAVDLGGVRVGHELGGESAARRAVGVSRPPLTRETTHQSNRPHQFVGAGSWTGHPATVTSRQPSWSCRQMHVTRAHLPTRRPRDRCACIRRPHGARTYRATDRRTGSRGHFLSTGSDPHEEDERRSTDETHADHDERVASRLDRERGAEEEKDAGHEASAEKVVAVQSRAPSWGIR